MFVICKCKSFHSLCPSGNEHEESMAELVRARRRRRLEASGEPFELRPCERVTDDQNTPLSVADILRMGVGALRLPTARSLATVCGSRSPARMASTIEIPVNPVKSLMPSWTATFH